MQADRKRQRQRDRDRWNKKEGKRVLGREKGRESARGP